jgi:hypothetical protein
MRFFPVRYLFKKTSVVRRKDGVQFGAGLRQGRLLIKTGSVKTGGSGSNQAERVRVLSITADSVQTILNAVHRMTSIVPVRTSGSPSPP